MDKLHDEGNQGCAEIKLSNQLDSKGPFNLQFY
jgi:hypothetical protein